jgi:hypothetical protein
LKSNLYPGPDKKTTKVTFIQAKGNLFPGSKDPKSNLYPGVRQLLSRFSLAKGNFYPGMAVASRSQKERDADDSS